MKTGRYLHYKGNYYIVIGTALHSETEEELVIYHPEYSDQLWARPRLMFEALIQHEGKTVQRFYPCE